MRGKRMNSIQPVWTKLRLDDMNLRILDELIGDARTPKMEIGKRLNLARSSVRERIEDMEAAGIIEGYTVIINWDKIDNGGK